MILILNIFQKYTNHHLNFESCSIDNRIIKIQSLSIAIAYRIVSNHFHLDSALTSHRLNIWKLKRCCRPKKHEKHQFNYVVQRATHILASSIVQMLIQFRIVYFLFQFLFSGLVSFFVLICFLYIPYISRTHIYVGSFDQEVNSHFNNNSNRTWHALYSRFVYLIICAFQYFSCYSFISIRFEYN